MRYLLLSLILIFPTFPSAQQLHTFYNGEVADAEKINENFEALKSEMSAAQSASPRMAWATVSGEVNGYWFQANDNAYIALKLPDDNSVYLSPFDPRDPEQERREEEGDECHEEEHEEEHEDSHDESHEECYEEDFFDDTTYYSEPDCQGAAYLKGAYAHRQMLLIISNSDYFLKRTNKRSSDAEDLVSQSFFMEVEGDRQCQNSETTIDSTFWETEQTTLLTSDLNKPHRLIWLD